MAVIGTPASSRAPSLSRMKGLAIGHPPREAAARLQVEFAFEAGEEIRGMTARYQRAHLDATAGQIAVRAEEFFKREELSQRPFGPCQNVGFGHRRRRKCAQRVNPGLEIQIGTTRCGIGLPGFAGLNNIFPRKLTQSKTPFGRFNTACRLDRVAFAGGPYDAGQASENTYYGGRLARHQYKVAFSDNPNGGTARNQRLDFSVL